MGKGLRAGIVPARGEGPLRDRQPQVPHVVQDGMVGLDERQRRSGEQPRAGGPAVVLFGQVREIGERALEKSDQVACGLTEDRMAHVQPQRQRSFHAHLGGGDPVPGLAVPGVEPAPTAVLPLLAREFPNPIVLNSILDHALKSTVRLASNSSGAPTCTAR